ncbi:NAD-dependent malic enzyme [Bifidobacterium gallicum]|uniref:Malate oxidoreductase n=1 Tax=Bifidobacterium gallicum DSM 20093 = LMG 11596 TaxID=561180 RepID=D1NW47_9BIFI|nr:NAD-dependent malic enzyme [Bifidobacterium gallicum]EFA22333.1 malic enzyme, NAD binding domain protein [Bifidobacterium gallicum DSM 20093 = LMG 11596]KFI60048.1 malate oxidoreductase [Bifidobacterium gallicum DSM 20093 = LMG 11596]
MTMTLPESLTNPLLNKSTAFTQVERHNLGLVGRLPSAVETLDQQLQRCYSQLHACTSNLERYLYLDQLHRRSDVLYYRLLVDHLAELMPIVYDPTIAEAIKNWSADYRGTRAVYLSVDRIEDIDESFDNLGLGPDDVDLIVASDAEAILGIGDWGVNGTDISIGKLAIYTAAAGVDPARVIAVNLDCGTDNTSLLEDPVYLGNRHARVRGKQYDRFIAAYLRSAAQHYPHALLHFEDFGPSNARRIINEYRDTYRVFNDDMQGTGAVVIAAVMAGLRVTGQTFADQRLLVYGAGTAGTGMADQIHAAMMRDGLTDSEARERIWLIDRNGLVTDDMPDLPDYQAAYARPRSQVAAADWRRDAAGHIGLLETVRHVAPTILIGTSTDHGAFTQDVIEAMAAQVQRPIILPLSNPTERIEAMPQDVIRWSDGRALVATGIPVDPFDYNGVTYTIGQGNNALLYPGLGLGVIVSGARTVTDMMLLAAAQALASHADATTIGAALLPPVSDLRASSALVAAAVARQAEVDNVATVHSDDWDQTVRQAMWWPAY